MIESNTMRSTYIFLVLLFPALALVNAWWFGRELKAFVDSTPVISSTNDIERMKTVVGRQMYAALVQVVLLTAGPAIYFVGMFRGALGPADVMFIILPSAAVIVLASVYKRVETKAKGIPVPDEELRRQRDTIVHTWLKKPLPDW